MSIGYRILAILLLVCAIGGFVWWQEDRVSDAEERATKAEDDARSLSQQLNQAKSGVRVVTKYVDRVKIVREVGKTITKEIPVYVTAEADDRCTVPSGFVSVHNAAAENVPLAVPAGDPDAPAAGIALSDVAETVSGNYGTCHENAEQLIGLQDWLLGIGAQPQ